MNIFELPRYKWWENMKTLIENVNLDEIIMIKNNYFKFGFSNSYNGEFCKRLDCSNIIKCCIENDAFEDEVFSYFVLDVFIKELSSEEIKSALSYYKYGFNINLSEIDKLYLILINGNEICMDIICGRYELSSKEDKVD